MNRFFTIFSMIIVFMMFHVNCAGANDYDTVLIGNISNYHTINGKYYFDFEEGEEAPDSYTFTGQAKDFIDIQTQKALNDIAKNKQKFIAIKLSMDRPVDIQSVTEKQLYIQPSPIQKNDHALVGVCLPETDDCWKVKIAKNNPQFKEITTSIPGNEVIAYYTKDRELLACYTSGISLSQNNYSESYNVQNKTQLGQKIEYSSRIGDIFRAENIHTTVQYFDKKYGPAKHDNGDFREYDIDGCRVETSGNQEIESITLYLTPQCTVDMSQFLNHATSSYGMTFGDFERDDVSLVYDAICFREVCGNMVEPSVQGHAILSHAQNFLELLVLSEYNGEDRFDFDQAYRNFRKEDPISDEEWDNTYNYCSIDISPLLRKYFQNVKINKITIGYNLYENYCSEN